ncbi:MAG TPA: 1-acyl-sn-glycerol-3-phosphate acyltransferase [Burkholderiales bacterium]|nr:1-acyl-sn-glycerol-3-phosphate acyltransferase [Burkholderiales bacterium]
MDGSVPAQRPPTLTRRWAHRLLALFGWTADIAWPPAPRAVIVVYPHTSNWDFVVGIVARYAAGFPVQWVGKDSLFRGPFGTLLRSWGGIPVNRRQSTGFIGQLMEEFRRRSWMWVVFTPEGTRSYRDYWKSGFYYLALEAKVPVGLAYIDYKRRQVGLQSYIVLTGDVERDLDAMRAVYAGKVGKHPELAGPIRFHEDQGTAGGWGG